MQYRKILLTGLLLCLGFLTVHLIKATAQNLPQPQQNHIADVAITGLKNAETEAAYMMQAKSETYLLSRDPVYGENDNLTSADEVIDYLSKKVLEKRVSRWWQNGKEGKLDAIWYNLNKETGDTYTSLFSSGFDGENSYSYLSPPKSHTGNGWITNGGKCANGFLIGTPWGGNFSISGDFSSELSAASPHFAGKETINGFSTLKFTGLIKKKDAEIDYKVWICPERSFRCVRKEIQTNFKGTQYKQGNTTYETLSFRKYNKDNQITWLPQKGVSLDFLVDNSGKRYWRTLDWFNLLEAEPLPQLKQSVFTFQFPLGTTVSNSNEQIVPTASTSQSTIAQQLKDIKVDKDIHDFVQQVIDQKVE